MGEIPSVEQCSTDSIPEDCFMNRPDLLGPGRAFDDGVNCTFQLLVEEAAMSAEQVTNAVDKINRVACAGVCARLMLCELVFEEVGATDLLEKRVDRERRAAAERPTLRQDAAR